ncbi:MAG TPA: response regulator [Chthoniobacteraceae bacterium]|jgi:DNA-binding response OmpR family regulator
MSQLANVTTGNFTDAPPAPEVIPAPTLRIHGSEEENASKVRKILLLEDDPSFKEIMSDFLRESGFEVIAVQNGVEGVHQVLASDFEVILCDMMMPTLPGDMFFRAVERMRPHLCDRFVFMTGHRGNAKVNDFITNVNGTILTKPFHVDDLLELIAFIQVRVHLLAA